MALLLMQSISDKDTDEVTSLRNRVAELEGVVRELKNKPQPRWAANAIVQQSSTDPIHNPFQPPPSPAPAISFPKESWHVRSSRRDNADRENDGVGSRPDGNEKKRKWGETGLGGSHFGLGGGLFDESYSVVKIEQPPTSSSSFFGLEHTGGGDENINCIENDENASCLGSPLFSPPGSGGSHLVPLSVSSGGVPPVRRASVPTGSSLKFGGISVNGTHAMPAPRPATDTFNGVSPPFHHQDNRRSLTNPPPTISTLSHRVNR